jgi:hypothetical protein
MSRFKAKLKPFLSDIIEKTYEVQSVMERLPSNAAAEARILLLDGACIRLCSQLIKERQSTRNDSPSTESR